MTVRVKICGVTLAEDAEAAASMGADMIGLNFYPRSPRFLALARAREVRHQLLQRRELVLDPAVAGVQHLERLVEPRRRRAESRQARHLRRPRRARAARAGRA